MEQTTPYIDRVHQALSDNINGFNKTPDEFKVAMKSPEYVANVHTALKDNLNGFDKTLEDFHTNTLDPNPMGVKVPAKNFFAGYMASPIYKQRLATMGITESPDSKNILNTHIVNNSGGYDSFYLDKNKSKNYSDNPNWIGLGFDEDKPNINIDMSQIRDMKDLTGHPESPDNVLAHELSHSARTLSNNENKAIQNVNIKDKFPGFEHDNKSNEIKADLDAFRFMMYKKGIYDTSKRDMTIDDFNKAKSDKDISNSMIFNRLLKHIKPEDIIKLNNAIASNNTQQLQNNVS